MFKKRLHPVHFKQDNEQDVASFMNNIFVSYLLVFQV